jgi:hypothetical protein
MVKTMKFYKTILFSLLIITQISAQNKVGTTAADFLAIPIGARATAMGGAFVANAKDVTAAYWNPGALAKLSSSEFTASYADWIFGTNHNWAGLVIKLDNDNAFAISFNQVDYGEEEITTAQEPNGTGQFWDAADIAIGISYSRNLTDRFSIGGTFKYINSKIWNESATAFALDVGLLFITQFNGLRLGMNISNFGTEMQLDGPDLFQPIDIDPSSFGNNQNISGQLETDSWDLPLIFTVGVGMDVLNSEDWIVTVATDAVYPLNTTGYLNAGAELVWSNILYLRGGYNSIFEEASEEGLSAGIGLKYNIGGFNIGVDYSYVDFGQFDDISRYAVTIKF